MYSTRVLIICLFTGAILSLGLVGACYGQKSNVSVNLGYPVPTGDTFYSNFDGLLNIQLSYAQPVFKGLLAKGTIDYTRSKLTINQTLPNRSTTYQNIYKLILSAEVPIRIRNIVTLHPDFGLGYARLHSYNRQVDNSRVDNAYTIRLAFEISKNISSIFSIGVKSSYDYVRVGRREIIPNISYNQVLNSLNFGIAGTLHL